MKIGVNFRNWGPHATRENLLDCARIADESNVESVWVNDHVGFPPGEFENLYGVPEEMGHIVDPFATLAALAAVTSRVNFGSGVVVAPYRPPLLTAKWLQSVQHISGGRLLFGVAAGYFEAEFKALGVDIKQRGRITNDTLDFLRAAFEDDHVKSNGQDVVLEPKSTRPPFYIGGSPEVAIPRAVARGDGWIPVGLMPDQLAPLVVELNERAAQAGRSNLEVVIMKTLPLDDVSAALDLVGAYQAAGATRLVHTQAYATPDEYAAFVGLVSREIVPACE